MPTFRPSHLAAITILFDEQLGETPQTPTAASATAIISAPNFTGLRTESNDSNVKSVLVQPLMSEYTRNSAKTADTAKLRLAYLDCPYPAEAIRAAEVAIFMDNIEDTQVNTSFGQKQIVGGKSLHHGDLLQPSEQNLRFLGVVIEWDEHVDEGYVEVACEDFTRILQRQLPVVKDKDGNPKSLGIDKTMALDLAVQKLVNTIPLVGGRLNVFVMLDRSQGPQAAAGQLPAPSAYHPKTFGPADEHHQSAHGQTYWELITEVCQQSGFLVYVYLDKIIISTAQFIYDKDPNSGKQPSAPVMLFGENLKTLRFKRRLGSLKTHVVEVRSWCPDSTPPRVLIATWDGKYDKGGSPTISHRPASDTFSSGGTSAATFDPFNQEQATVDVVRFDIPPLSETALDSALPLGAGGIAQSVLDRICINTWYALAKNTISGSLSTDDTWSVARPNSSPAFDFQAFNQFPGQKLPGIEDTGPNNPDLYGLSTGDPIQVGIRPLRDDEVDGPAIMLFASMTEDQIAQYLVERRNFQDKDVALSIAKIIKSPSRTTVFRVRTMNVRNDAEHKSLEVQIEFSDFVQAHDHPNRTVASNLDTVQTKRQGRGSKQSRTRPRNF